MASSGRLQRRDHLHHRPVPLGAARAAAVRRGCAGSATARVRRRLLRDEDVHEDIVDEVHHHWVVYTLPILEVVAGRAVPLPVPGLLAAGRLAAAARDRGAARARRLEVARWSYLDVFVVTNMRVFRVTGRVLQQARDHPAVADPRHHRRPAVPRPAARLRPLHVRVRRPGAGAARHPVRPEAAAAGPGHPAPRADVGLRGPRRSEPKVTISPRSVASVATAGWVLQGQCS